MNEKEHAIMEGDRIAHCDEYFGARPSIDSPHNRKIFSAGFDRGYESREFQPFDRGYESPISVEQVA